ncbi:MAG: hypothetical protein DMG06_19385 [Acidobacteria bacterium]|nr:MAG: hypothetical protein DMG06_19385 [Acidobacteriota bacterium]
MSCALSIDLLLVFSSFTVPSEPVQSLSRWPPYPTPRKREDLFLIIGEIHNPAKPVPAENPCRLVIPERGLFTGVAIFGRRGNRRPASGGRFLFEMSTTRSGCLIMTTRGLRPRKKSFSRPG